MYTHVHVHVHVLFGVTILASVLYTCTCTCMFVMYTSFMYIHVHVHVSWFHPAQSAPVIQSTSDSIPVARSGTEPGHTSSLAHIMDEQTAEQISAREVVHVHVYTATVYDTHMYTPVQLMGRSTQHRP